MARPMITEAEVLARLAITRPTLVRLDPPIPFVRLGNGPRAQKRYRPEDVEAWIEARLTTGTATPSVQRRRSRHDHLEAVPS